jgi:hypothetical protein
VRCRCNSQSLCADVWTTARKWISFAITTLVVGYGTCAAFAQETPVLVAKPEPPHIDGWCGEYALHFQNVVNEAMLLDVSTGKQLRLKYGLSGVVLSCSPNGRWVLTENTDAGSGGGISREGGDPACDPPDQIELPRLVLWDIQSGRPQVVGRGNADFAWSPDGTLLLYRFRPFCNLELDRRNSFKLPQGVRAFQAISVYDLVQRALGTNSGWPDKGRIGVVRWYASDAFLVQLPVTDGIWLTDATEAGAIVSGHVKDGQLVRIEQVNPASFQSSWTLAIPQMPLEASNDVMKAARCAVLSVKRRPSSVSCDSPDDLMQTAVRPDLDRYCGISGAGDALEFCAPSPTNGQWFRIVRGPIVLVRKPVSNDGKSIAGFELFRIDGDRGGYLK